MSQKHSRQLTIQRCHSQLYISVRCRPYHFKFFKGCRPQILLGPFLNTLTYLQLRTKQVSLRYKTDLQHKLRERCPYSEFFWSVFSHIRTEFGKIRSISPYSVQMSENTNQKNSEYRHFHAVTCGSLFIMTILFGTPSAVAMITGFRFPSRYMTFSSSIRSRLFLRSFKR